MARVPGVVPEHEARASANRSARNVAAARSSLGGPQRDRQPRSPRPAASAARTHRLGRRPTGLAYDRSASAAIDLGGRSTAFSKRSADFADEPRADRPAVPGRGAAAVAGAPALPGARAGRTRCAPPIRAEVSRARRRRRVPGRRGDERHPPGPRRRRDQDRARQAQRRALRLPGDHLLVRGPGAVRHRDRAAWCCCTRSPRACCRAAPRLPELPAFEISFWAAHPAAAAAHDDRRSGSGSSS